MPSPNATKLLYRVTKDGYFIVDFTSGKKIFIENDSCHPFFSPDDKFVCIAGSKKFYDASNGTEVQNPFPFDIQNNLTHYSTCDAILRRNIMATRYDRGNSSIQIWDYVNQKLLTTIEDDFIVKNAAFAFTKNTLIVHTDYGTVSVYNCKE